MNKSFDGAVQKNPRATAGFDVNVVRTPDGKTLSSRPCECVQRCENRDSDSGFCRCRCHRGVYVEISELRKQMNAVKLSRTIDVVLRREDENRLWYKALGLTHSRTEAEELLQATCYRALTRAHQFDAELGAEGWLATIMRTVFIDDRRRWSNRNASIDAVTPDGEGVAFTLSDGQPTPEEVMLDAEKMGEGDRFVESVVRLKPKYREVVSLVVLGGETLDAASKKLGIPMGTVKSRLSRVGRILRSLTVGEK